MGKLALATIFLALLLVSQSYAYTDDGTAFYCNSCSDCRGAVNNETFKTVYLTADIIDEPASCIGNQINFTNVIFDCQGYSIDGAVGSDKGFWMTSKTGNTIRNCQITGFDTGIYGFSANSSNLTNNTITDTGTGISLYKSHNSILFNNSVNSNQYGIYNGNCINNTITDNIVNSNGQIGIYFRSSSENVLTGNTMSGNKQDLFITNMYDTGPLSDFNHTIDTTNTVNSKPVYYYFDASNLVFDGLVNDTNHLTCAFCDNADISNINSVNGDSIYFAYTNNSLIRNLTTSSSEYGLNFRHSYLNTISNSVLNSNKWGIYYISSGNNTLSHSNLDSNRDGAELYLSNYNKLINNTVNSNNNYGIYIYTSIGNLLENNTANSNLNNGVQIYKYSDWNILRNNTLNTTSTPILIHTSTPIFIHTYSSNNTLTNNTIISGNDGIRTYYALDNLITNNSIKASTNGISLYSYSNNNTISNNRIRGSSAGIAFMNSDSNVLTGNIIYDSNNYGLSFDGNSKYNLVYNNIFIDNLINVIDMTPATPNYFNIALTAGTNIIGGPWIGGNYWHDYIGIDSDADEIGDTLVPYNCTDRIILPDGDYFPLVNISVVQKPLFSIIFEEIIDIEPPIIKSFVLGLEIIYPNNDVTISVDASDNEDIDKVEASVNGNIILLTKIDGIWKSSFTAPGIGSYIITITVTDVNGLTKQDTIAFTVRQKQAPIISGGGGGGGSFIIPIEYKEEKEEDEETPMAIENVAQKKEVNPIKYETPAPNNPQSLIGTVSNSITAFMIGQSSSGEQISIVNNIANTITMNMLGVPNLNLIVDLISQIRDNFENFFNKY